MNRWMGRSPATWRRSTLARRLWRDWRDWMRLLKRRRRLAWTECSLPTGGRSWRPRTRRAEARQAHEPPGSLSSLWCPLRARPLERSRWLATPLSPLPGTAAAKWWGPCRRRPVLPVLLTGSGGMSRSVWRCRNPACSEPHGAVLGRVTTEGGLVLDPAVTGFQAYLDSRKVLLTCPACGARREFRGKAVLAEGRSWYRAR
jgi:hypothetical protein